ncbi:heterokaryon incompatibility protein [Rutstroemia sp. NJR-2017a BVV2]|nr:heterokaryon incompatibility protein [Rutstroemia sp. NJR-2017a BVV2]
MPDPILPKPHMQPQVLGITTSYCLNASVRFMLVLRWEMAWKGGVASHLYYKCEDGSPGYDLVRLAYRALRVIKLGRASMQLPPPETFGNVVPEDEENFLTNFTPGSIYYAWRSIAELYSARQLTKQNDRLSAISGLASLVAEYMEMQPSTYLAGIWLDDLPQGLLWYVKPLYLVLPQRPLVYTAPTWSWASINGGIAYFRESYQFHFKSSITILQATCRASRFDLTGKVSEGLVNVRGEVVPVHLNVIPIPQEYKSEYNGTNGNAPRTHAEQLVLVRSRTGQGRHSYEILGDVRLSGLPLRQESTYDSCWVKGSCSDQNCGCQFASNGSRIFCCLKIGVTIDTKSYGQRHWWLLLEQLPGNQNFYQRVGLGYYQVLYRGFHLFVNAKSHTITIV